MTESGEAASSKADSIRRRSMSRIQGGSLPLVFPLILSSNFSHIHLLNVFTISQEEAQLRGPRVLCKFSKVRHHDHWYCGKDCASMQI